MVPLEFVQLFKYRALGKYLCVPQRKITLMMVLKMHAPRPLRFPCMQGLCPPLFHQTSALPPPPPNKIIIYPVLSCTLLTSYIVNRVYTADQSGFSCHVTNTFLSSQRRGWPVRSRLSYSLKNSKESRISHDSMTNAQACTPKSLLN